MAFFLIAFIAGVLTVLAPCILPLLPVVIGASVGARSKTTPYVVIGSLALSIFLFTYLLKASTALISIPSSVWSYVSGGILLLFGVILVFPVLWERISLVSNVSVGANKVIGAGHHKKSVWGDIMIGAALGPVFSSCSPTYFVILATVLPASFLLGTAYLLVYIAGLMAVLLPIALFGQRITDRLLGAANSNGVIKRIIGIVFIVVGVFIMTGLDKKVETWVLDRGYIDGVLEIEQSLLEDMSTRDETTNSVSTERMTIAVPAFNVPPALSNNFPGTDFSQADPRLVSAISGGPSKDGIPALDDPHFVPLREFDRPDAVQAIVIVGETETKVYPYNILTWHEIVNDEIDGVPVAVTFCPLCGSAIVYKRTLPDGEVSTFGVSGSLLESNMIMYDRATESLWQQSTGVALAGAHYPAALTLESFQLLTLGDVRATYPGALVLSEDTGYVRDYARNPYAGYDTNDRFVFNPSDLDTRFAPKTIMVVFQVGGITYTAPWLALREAGNATVSSHSTKYSLVVSDSGELYITDASGRELPFYFEMWFSVAVQHESIILVEL